MVAPHVDRCVISSDPGSLKPTLKINTAERNNINRQLVSSLAGIKSATRPYILKVRSDCLIQGSGFVNLYNNVCKATGEQNRIVCPSFFTRHQQGLSCYLFHVSDWFSFGDAESINRLWSANLMSEVDSSYYDDKPHKLGATYAAKRFRARYTPEQHITCQYAKNLGYRTPEYLDHLNDELVDQHKKFAARHFIIAEPDMLGIVLPKYNHLSRSLYMLSDCMSFYDWNQIFRRETGVELGQSKFFNRSKCIVATRFVFHIFRKQVIYAVLMSKGATKKFNNLLRRM